MTMPFLTPNWSRPVPAVSWPWPDPNRRAAAEEEAAQVDRLATIRTPAEADKTTAGTVLLDKIGDVWQHGVVSQTLWEDRLDYWTTPGDEEGHGTDAIVYPARIIYQPEERQ